MKIAIIAKNPYYYEGKKISPYLAGHSVGFVAPFIKFLIKKDHRVVLISPLEYKEEERDASKYFYFPPNSKNFDHIFLKSINLPKVPFNFGDLLVQSAILKAKKKMKGLDVVLVVYIFPWIVSINYLKKEINFKTIAFLRGSDVFSGCYKNSIYKNNFKGGDWEIITKMMINSINKSNLVYCVSNMLKKFSNKQGIRVDKISPTPPFPESFKIKQLKISKKMLRKKLLKHKWISNQFKGINVNNKWIAYLGRFHSEKQVNLVVKAFNMSKNKDKNSLILAGTGLEEENLKKVIRKFNLKNVYIGFIPPKLIPLFCKSIDILIHPTTPESFLDARPSSCMNASYMCIPVIFPYKEGVECTGLNETVSKLNTTLLTVNPKLKNKEIVRKIAEKLDTILGDEKLYKKVSKANSIFSEKFNSNFIFREIEEDIKSV